VNQRTLDPLGLVAALAALPAPADAHVSVGQRGPKPKNESMAVGMNGARVSMPLLTIGETLENTNGALKSTTAGDYTPVGILDGMGALDLDGKSVRIFIEHELLNFRGNAYEVSDGHGATFTMTGARVSCFDIDKASRRVIDDGLAYDTIYDANDDVASDTSFLLEGFGGFSRSCSSQLVEAGTPERSASSTRST